MSTCLQGSEGTWIASHYALIHSAELLLSARFELLTPEVAVIVMITCQVVVLSKRNIYCLAIAENSQLKQLKYPHTSVVFHTLRPVNHF